jgi:hypothetical protein
MIILGIILLVIGFIAKIAVLWSIGIILLVDVLSGGIGETLRADGGQVFPTSRGSQADVDRSRCASLIGSTIWGSKAAHWTLWR